MYAKVFSLKNIEMALLLLAIGTAPFDELLVWEYNNFTIRYSLIVLCIALVVGFVAICRQKELVLPTGWQYLAAILVLNGILCILNRETSILRLAGYEVWLMLDMTLVVLAVNVIKTEQQKKTALNFFLGVFDVMTGVCILQFLLGIFQIQFYTNQMYGPFVRCDAFLSEPSYYACFAVPGWVFLTWLRERNDTRWYSDSYMKRSWALITISLILSSSRMGMLTMIAWILFRMCVAIAQKNKAQVWRLLKMAAFFAMGELLLQGFSIIIKPFMDSMNSNRTFFDHLTDMSGSDTPRIVGMKNTLLTFLQNNFFIGSSLGGVETRVQNYLVLPGITVSNLMAELGVALGFPGLLLLIGYIFKLISTSVKQKNVSVATALLWAVLWQLGILQFNNNGLRIYLWVNLAMLSLYLPQKVVKGKT